MSARKASSISQQFSQRLQLLDGIRTRVESSYAGKHLRLTDVETSYEGLFLQVVLAYESAMEDFVLGLLVHPGGIVSSIRGVRPHVTVRSYRHARDLVSGPGKAYPSWTKREDLEGVARLFLVGGAPFVDVADPGAFWHFVRQSIVIRNAIAHPSEHARLKFEKNVIGSTPLPRRERKVAAYLRGRATGAAQTRWELLAAGLSLFVSKVAI